MKRFLSIAALALCASAAPTWADDYVVQIVRVQIGRAHV